MQHLQPGLPQGIEFLSGDSVISMVRGVVDIGGFGYCLSFALTSILDRFLALLRQRHGLGTLSFSCGFGLMICLSFFVLRFGVYSILRKVS